MAGTSHNCKTSRPCRICGKPDYCNWVDFANGDILEYCHRITGSKGDIINGRMGGQYRCRRVTEGNFTVWEPLAQYERNKEAYLREKMPNRRSRGGDIHSRIDAPRYVEDVPEDKEAHIVEGVADILPPDALDRFYRTFLELLLIEDKHRIKLQSEWEQVSGLYSRMVHAWPIRSVPPEDRVRFSSQERLRNPSRKRIMAQLIERCGEPKGVPGFYQRTDDVWTFCKLCGLAFPVFDSYGHIVRIRINDDYPAVDGELGGREGIYVYEAREKGCGWFFAQRRGARYDYEGAELVWSYGASDNRISLTDKGHPPGKVRGKYKNFSSFQEKVVLGVGADTGKDRYINLYRNGCQSGSHCSLFMREGDDPAVVYATEGEKKAIVANAMLHVPVISIPGVSAFGRLFENEAGQTRSMMRALAERGMRLVVLVYDADKKQNAMVLRSEKQAVSALMKSGLKVAIGEWNGNWGKGLDDILLSGVLPRISMVNG